MRPSASIRVVRRLIGALEWVLRLVVTNRRLPPAKTLLRDQAYGDHPQQRLDVVVPEGAGPFPLMIYVHGGAWVVGDKSNFSWVTRSFAANGLLVFNVNYRWAPEAGFREQLHDVARAIIWATAHAREHGGDAGAVFLAGDSAGAHLVSWLHMALTQPSLLAGVDLEPPLPPGALRGSLLFYGIYDLCDAWSLGSSSHTPIRSLLGAEPSDQPALAALASPLRHVCADAAPVFVCVGEKDALYTQSLRLIEELERKQVQTRPLLLGRREHPDAGHSFLNFGGREASQLALREALAFIRGQLDPAGAAGRAPSRE